MYEKVMGERQLKPVKAQPNYISRESIVKETYHIFVVFYCHKRESAILPPAERNICSRVRDKRIYKSIIFFVNVTYLKVHTLSNMNVVSSRTSRLSRNQRGLDSIELINK